MQQMPGVHQSFMAKLEYEMYSSQWVLESLKIVTTQWLWIRASTNWINVRSVKFVHIWEHRVMNGAWSSGQRVRSLLGRYQVRISTHCCWALCKSFIPSLLFSAHINGGGKSWSVLRFFSRRFSIKGKMPDYSSDCFFLQTTILTLIGPLFLQS